LTERAPRRTQMVMNQDGGKPPLSKPREEKLAAALRANLRRRKAAAPAPKPPKAGA
jgi:hypothetical protein